MHARIYIHEYNQFSTYFAILPESNELPLQYEIEYFLFKGKRMRALLSTRSKIKRKNERMKKKEKKDKNYAKYRIIRSGSHF